jgi:predicted nucleic acid-binding protein
MLIDSNLIIYSALPDHGHLRDFIFRHVPLVSDVSKVEVLGYHALSAAEAKFFTDFFDSAVLLPITAEIIDEAVRLKQARKLKLGAALIEATAVVHDLELLTNNVKDFDWIKGLSILNPLAENN